MTFVESYRPNRVAARRFLPKLGVEFAMLSVHDHEGLARVFAEERTKLLLFEAPTNPMMQVPDLEAIVRLAKRHDVVTVLDNTFAGLHNHGKFEIDYFVHSMTKYANGHGDVMGGIVIADKKRIRAIKPLAINMGATLDPGAAFLIARGLKTYFIRYRQHSASALAIAEFLAKRKEVARVFYPGLASDPGHSLARKQMSEFGGVLSFDLNANKEQTWAFIDALELFTTTVELGVHGIAGRARAALPRLRSHGRGAEAGADQRFHRAARGRPRARRRSDRRSRSSAAQDRPLADRKLKPRARSQRRIPPAG